MPGEKDIVKYYSEYLALYKRLIDDIFAIWCGPKDIFLEFWGALNNKTDRIILSLLRDGPLEKWAVGRNQKNSCKGKCPKKNSCKMGLVLPKCSSSVSSGNFQIGNWKFSGALPGCYKILFS